jgi:hypothetical protein
MPSPRGLRVTLFLSLLFCEAGAALGQPGIFSGKMVFFGAKKHSDDKSTILVWSPSGGPPTRVASFDDELVLNGRISPNAGQLAVTTAPIRPDQPLGKWRVVTVDSRGHCKKVAADSELVAWYPDSASILCRSGDQYQWSHSQVDIGSRESKLLPIDPQDAVMDISPNGMLSVMKGRPEALWERQPGDLYPKRQLYSISQNGEKMPPFTSAEEDCIWWRFNPRGKGGVYYRRHYNSGRPVETAMFSDGSNSQQLVDFTELGVRPSGLPAWEPTGKEIAWIVTREITEDQLEYEILFVQLDGRPPRFVTSKELGLSWLGKIDWR